MNAVTCLQHFLNSVTREARHARLDLSNLLLAPLTRPVFASGHEPLHPVPYSVSSGMFNFAHVIGTGTNSLHACFIKSAWEAEHTSAYNASTLTLSTATVDWANLGDFVAFSLLRLQEFQDGVWAGLSLLFVRQLCTWLEQTWVHLLDFKPMIDIPDLRGFADACRKDLPNQRRLVVANEHLETDRVWCTAYLNKWATLMSHANSHAYTVVSVGGRSSGGAAMQVFYLYNPDENLGVYSPFGVPLSQNQSLCVNVCLL